jgi:hypothetical protein
MELGKGMEGVITYRLKVREIQGSHYGRYKGNYQHVSITSQKAIPLLEDTVT